MTYIERIHDVATGEITERPYTKAEMDEAKANEARLLQEAAAENNSAAVKLALLEKLGLTQDEAKLLLS